jgi:hypothetical protein
MISQATAMQAGSDRATTPAADALTCRARSARFDRRKDREEHEDSDAQPLPCRDVNSTHLGVIPALV